MADFDWSRLARQIADGAEIDWEAVTSRTPAAPARTAIEILRRVTSTPVRRVADAVTEPPSLIEALTKAFAAVALFQSLVALATTTGGLHPAVPGAVVSPAIQLITLIVMTGGGAWLALVAAGNQSAEALSCAYLGIAAAFAGSVANAGSWRLLVSPTLVSGIARLPGDLALPAAVWFFVLTFPRLERGTGLQRVTRGAANAVSVLLAALCIANIAALVAPAILAGSRWMRSIDRGDLRSHYSADYFLVIGAAAPFALARLRYSYVRDRPRIRRFFYALMLGFAPVAILSVVGAGSRAGAAFLLRPRVMPVATILVFAGLWTLPLTTGSALLAGRLLPTRSILRTSIRYALAQWTLAAMIVVPILELVRLAIENRNQPLGVVFGGPGRVWVAIAGVSVLLAAVRPQILRFVDRMFLRGRADVRSLVAELTAATRRQTNAHRIAELLLQAVDQACHPQSAAMLVPSHEGGLAPFVGGAGAIRADSSLVALLASSPRAVVLQPPPRDAIANLIPAADRAEVAGWSALVPIAGEADALVGVVCLGPPASADGYSRDDVSNVEMLAGAVGQVLGQHLASGARPAAQPEDRPAVECVRCGLVAHQAGLTCECGGALTGAALPLRLGQFRILRRLGRGGMGIVYEARDETLDRTVALKALPEVGPGEIATLESEARLMATLQHPSIAVVFGLERRRAMPVLIVEYLAGGTLERRLITGPLAAAEVASLGRSLADALEYLHGVGIYHRDLKPSNVGFTSTGHVKLFDLGVAVRKDAEHRPGGTLLYLSPEVLAGAPASVASDLWSLAVLLCEAWLGRHPLAGLTRDEQLARLRDGSIWAAANTTGPHADPVLQAVLARALEPDPSKRFACAAEFAAALIAAGAL